VIFILNRRKQCTLCPATWMTTPNSVLYTVNMLWLSALWLPERPLPTHSWVQIKHTSLHSYNRPCSRPCTSTEDCDAACCATGIACSDMAMCGTAEFYSRLQVLKRLQALWRAGKPVVIEDDESDVEPEANDVLGVSPGLWHRWSSRNYHSNKW